MITCATQIWLFHIKSPVIDPLQSLLRTTSRFSLVNNYGPFAVMTTERKEIIVQGSDNGLNWSDYHFKYKPGALNGKLGWNIPHQPRLDWQMWFEALNPKRRSIWFEQFLLRLLQGSPQVLALLEHNPFPDKPPKYIRALIYPYTFSSAQQGDRTGQIWQRGKATVYNPAISLKDSHQNK